MEGDPVWQAPATAHDAPARRELPDWDGLWCGARWRRPKAGGDASRCQPAGCEAGENGARLRARQPGYPPGCQPQRAGAGGFAWWPGARWRSIAPWLTAAALAGVAGLVLFRVPMPSSSPVSEPVVQAAADPHPLPVPRAARTKRTASSPAVATEEDHAPVNAHARYSPPTQDPPLEALPTAIPEQAAIRAAMLPPAAAGDSPREGGNALSGDWIFVPAAVSVEGGYPPEYIELRLRELEGVMRGSYRARYRVTDRAISPNVAFQFEGRTGAEGGILPWRGPGGSQGEVTLRLLATGTLEVAWEADRLGEELGLISGAATLVRKLE